MPSSAHWTPLFSPSLSLMCLSPSESLVETRRQDCYLWDRHQADLRLSSLLPCGSHWKQMVSKQPVMFTAAAIKDKSPTTHSLRSPTGLHRGLQTAAWGGPLALHTHAWTHTRTPWTDSYLNYHPNASITKHSHTHLYTDTKTARHALQMSSANPSGHATFTAIKQACHLNIWWHLATCSMGSEYNGVPVEPGRNCPCHS